MKTTTHRTSVTSWPPRWRSATEAPQFDWRCTCGTAGAGYTTRAGAEQEAAEYLRAMAAKPGSAEIMIAERAEPVAVVVITDGHEPDSDLLAKLRDLSAFLDHLAQEGKYWTPTGADGERRAGAQALADTSARIQKLITEGTYE